MAEVAPYGSHVAIVDHSIHAEIGNGHRHAYLASAQGNVDVVDSLVSINILVSAFMLTGVLGSTCPELLVTFINVTVIFCTSVIFLRFTVMVFPEKIRLSEICPTPPDRGGGTADDVLAEDEDQSVPAAAIAAFHARLALVQ